jgi:hypothetical protein
MVSSPLAVCQDRWRQSGFVPLDMLLRVLEADKVVDPQAFETRLRQLFVAFNGSAVGRVACEKARNRGDLHAAAVLSYMQDHEIASPGQIMPRPDLKDLRLAQEADPHRDVAQIVDTACWPCPEDAGPYAYSGAEIGRLLTLGRTRFDGFAAARRSDTAILVGNGPSLRQMDFSLFRGQDLYISNYAIREASLASLARGVGVSNALVAGQEPYVFQLTDMWKFHPYWLGHLLGDSEQTVWLDAQGGELFFSTDVRQRIAWHSTVTFFWLQILYSAGYRKVLLVGVDNSYVQVTTAREGDLIRQEGDDANHFDPGYFRGKIWQAADTDRMAQTYMLAKQAYESDGREIVNCGIGGQLDLFRRADLAAELPAPQVTSFVEATDVPDADLASGHTMNENLMGGSNSLARYFDSSGDAGTVLLRLALEFVLAPAQADLMVQSNPGLVQRVLDATPSGDPRRALFLCVQNRSRAFHSCNESVT